MSSSTPTPTSPFLFLDPSNLKIPSTHYSHTISLGPSPVSNESKGVTIELHIQGWYKLYLEPLRGIPPVTMDKCYSVSPKCSYKFKIPLFLFLADNNNNTSSTNYIVDSYTSQQLVKLPIGLGLARYLQPHIVNNAMALVRTSPTTECKVVFDVKVVKIDLADHQECDGYRRRGLV